MSDAMTSGYQAGYPGAGTGGCVVKRALVAAFLTAFGSSAFADEPLLMRPPYPPGFVVPKRHFNGAVPFHSPDPLPAFCGVFDVGIDGKVSNFKILRSIGSSKLDDIIVKWWSEGQYDPATLNGTPIAVRLLAKYMPSRDSSGDCNWSLYDSQVASPANPGTQP
jgi:hypothetical protein